MEFNPLQEPFDRTTYKIAGHGRRNVQVLKEALGAMDGETEGDMYGKGELIEAFQKKMANVLGKPSAVFFPSGTMAQQIALRIWCDRKGLKKVAYHPLSHLEIHEEDGLKTLHGIETVLLADRTRTVGFDDVRGMTEDVACVLLELPQREIGGVLPPFEELEAISAYCKEKGIRLHLDGARLFESLPYYGKTAAEVCALFDSVYISLYKGIGGVAGAILAGNEPFAAESKVWKRRHGGDLIHLYPYIVAADYYFDRRVDKMAQYAEEAKELAARFNRCLGIETKPAVPETNMFHVHIAAPIERMEAVLAELYAETGVGLTHYLRNTGEGTSYFEVSIGDRYAAVPKDALDRAFALLEERMRAL